MIVAPIKTQNDDYYFLYRESEDDQWQATPTTKKKAEQFCKDHATHIHEVEVQQ